MKPTIILTALTLGLITPLALAKNCKGGLIYCGRGLINKGNYYDQIVVALRENGESTDDNHVSESTFFCKGDGNIIFQAFCKNGCANGGADKSDFCSE